MFCTCSDWLLFTSSCGGMWRVLEDPGLLHFVPLRPYHGIQEMRMRQKREEEIVGAQWNEVQ
jgi:hypothetical protein